MLTIYILTITMLTKRHSHLHLHFAHLLEERLRVRLAPLGIHPRQARVLDLLEKLGQASQVTCSNFQSMGTAR
ncbi:hypothetical protein IMCC3135_17680 [Granulosicoccus antarcticus IMCC3135]|uniref:Uncharacterized protein n=1 Tax=Granulosicoccus antarcticus IMCC3135 TaxID=1192854 RepID=A0A2Z2NSX2_9GAMM|nr:hypothetical protein IMCC3135_17680 [Granulosicoccus antarcticus IMCC3135]